MSQIKRFFDKPADFALLVPATKVISDTPVVSVIIPWAIVGRRAAMLLIAATPDDATDNLQIKVYRSWDGDASGDFETVQVWSRTVANPGANTPIRIGVDLNDRLSLSTPMTTLAANYLRITFASVGAISDWVLDTDGIRLAVYNDVEI